MQLLSYTVAQYAHAIYYTCYYINTFYSPTTTTTHLHEIMGHLYVGRRKLRHAKAPINFPNNYIMRKLNIQQTFPVQMACRP